MATPTSPSEPGAGAEAEAARLAAALEANGPAALQAAARRRLLGALLHAYAGERDGAPVDPERVDAIEAIVTVGDLLRAVQVTSFELAAMCDV